MLFSQRSRLGPPAFPTDAGLSDCGDDGEQRQHLPAGSSPEDAARALVLGRHPALDRPGHGVRGPLRRQPATSTPGRTRTGTSAACSTAASSTSSSSRSATSRPTSRRAWPTAASPTPARPAPRRCRSTSAYMRRATRNASNPAAYTSRQLHATRRSSTASARSDPQVTAAPSAIDTAAFRANALDRRPATQPVRDEPDGRAAPTSSHDENWTNYNSLQLELRRRLSKGLLVERATTPTASRRLVAPRRWRIRASKSTPRTTATRRTPSR